MSPQTSSQSWLLRLAGLVLAFQCAFIARTSFVAQGVRHFVLFEDAMISMRYARNFARGDGLNWNRGEAPVEGYTNLLWTLWMSAIHRLGLSDAKVALPVMLTGLALVWVCAWMSYKIAARLSDVAWVPPVAAAATFCSYSLHFWSLRGMEVGAVAACASGLCYLALCHDGPPARWPHTVGMGMLGAATVMLRSDAILMLGLASCYAAWRSGKARGLAVLVLAMAPACLAVAAQWSFRKHYYGDTLPNTYYLKLAHISVLARVKRGLFVALQFVGYHAPIPLAVLGASCLALGVRGLRALRAAHGFAFVATLVATQAAYAVYVGGDAWEFMLYANRYWSAVAPLLAVLVTAALGEALKLGGSPRFASCFRIALLATSGAALLAMSWAALAPEAGIARTIQLSQKVLGLGTLLFVAALAMPLVAPALREPFAMCARSYDNARSTFYAPFATFVLLAVWGLGQAEPLLTWSRQNAAQYKDEEQYARLGLLLRDRTPADFRIAVMAAGATPYFADRPTEDLLGKSDAHVARLKPKGVFSPGHDKWDYGFSLRDRKPDLIVELSDTTEQDLQDIQSWGFSRLPGGMWLHAPYRVPASLFAEGSTP